MDVGDQNTTKNHKGTAKGDKLTKKTLAKTVRKKVFYDRVIGLGCTLESA